MYLTSGASPPVFRPLTAPGANDLQALIEQISARVGQALERAGLIGRDTENAWLADLTRAGPMDDLIGHAVAHRGRCNGVERSQPTRRPVSGHDGIRAAPADSIVILGDRIRGMSQDVQFLWTYEARRMDDRR